MFFGEMNTFSLKANLNIAIIEMTNTRNMEIGNKTITRVSFIYKSVKKNKKIIEISYRKLNLNGTPT